ncbi:hypothetical protein ABB02_00753 [Clostridiaceae bacterium JG1575]|nr:hypothetical protein ABB02_00753 [Clostridiaceae bacterium JG1575]
MELLQSLLKGFGNAAAPPRSTPPDETVPAPELAIFDGDANALAQRANLSPGKMQELLSIGMPLILRQLGENSQSEEGVSSLSRALDDHARRTYHDAGAIDAEDGLSILGHLFGPDQSKTLSSELGARAGIDQNQALSALSLLAPLALAWLANKRRNTQMNPESLQEFTQKAAQETKGTLYDALRQRSSLEESAPQGSQGLLNSILGGLFGK